jgi:predicted DNA-binding protein (MmcQ/YjbR family)
MKKKDIIEYCLTFQDVYEDYPFDGNWAAMRHNTNKKCFAFIYERHGKLCVNLKCEPNEAYILRQIYNDVIPAYHMNKENWNTVIINGDVPKEALIDMIRRSYDLIKPKNKRK